MAPKGGLVGSLIGKLEGRTMKSPRGAASKRGLPGLVDAEAASLAYATSTIAVKDAAGSLSSANTPDKGGDGSLTTRTTSSTAFTDGSMTARSDYDGGTTSRSDECDGGMTARTTSSAMTDNRFKVPGADKERRRRRKPDAMSPSLIGSVCSDVSDEVMSEASGGLTQRSMLSDGGMTDRTNRSGHRTERSGREDRRSKSRGPGGKRDRSESRSGFSTARGERGKGELDFYVVPEEGEEPGALPDFAKGKRSSEAMAEDRAAELEARLMSSGLTPKMADLGRWSSPRAAKSPRLAKDSFMPITPTTNPVFKNAMKLQQAMTNPETIKKATRAVVAASPCATPTARGCLPPKAPKTPVTTPRVKGCGLRMPLPFKLSRSSSSKAIKDK